MKPLPGVVQLLRLSAADSTQGVAKLLAEQGAPDRTLVWAEAQSAGRGQLSRRWASARGGLYISLILRPSFPPSRLAEFSLMTAAAAAAALSAHAGLRAAVKPPNDVLAWPPVRARRSWRGRAASADNQARPARARSRPKKVCGILAETSGGSRRLDWLVVGVGINVNNPLSGLPEATSLKALTGRAWDIEGVLRRFLAQFENSYDSFLNNAAHLDQVPGA